MNLSLDQLASFGPSVDEVLTFPRAVMENRRPTRLSELQDEEVMLATDSPVLGVSPVGLIQKFMTNEIEGRTVAEAARSLGVLISDSEITQSWIWQSLGERGVFPVHWHESDEVVACLEGEVYVWGVGWDVTIKPREKIIIPAQRAHGAFFRGVMLVQFEPPVPLVNPDERSRTTHSSQD